MRACRLCQCQRSQTSDRYPPQPQAQAGYASGDGNPPAQITYKYAAKTIKQVTHQVTKIRLHKFRTNTQPREQTGYASSDRYTPTQIIHINKCAARAQAVNASSDGNPSAQIQYMYNG
jgi:hypothetical protein